MWGQGRGSWRKPARGPSLAQGAFRLSRLRVALESDRADVSAQLCHFLAVYPGASVRPESHSLTCKWGQPQRLSQELGEDSVRQGQGRLVGSVGPDLGEVVGRAPLRGRWDDLLHSML